MAYFLNSWYFFCLLLKCIVSYYSLPKFLTHLKENTIMKFWPSQLSVGFGSYPSLNFISLWEWVWGRQKAFSYSHQHFNCTILLIIRVPAKKTVEKRWNLCKFLQNDNSTVTSPAFSKWNKIYCNLYKKPDLRNRFGENKTWQNYAFICNLLHVQHNLCDPLHLTVLLNPSYMGSRNGKNTIQA